MTDLSTLLSRVESGSGEDRETDIEIATTLGGFVLEKRGRDQKAWLYPVGADYGRLDPHYPGPYGRVLYTTDLNAVIALVEARAGHDAAHKMLLAIMNGALFCVSKSIGPQLCRHLLAALIRAEMEKVK